MFAFFPSLFFLCTVRVLLKSLKCPVFMFRYLFSFWRSVSLWKGLSLLFPSGAAAVFGRHLPACCRLVVVVVSKSMSVCVRVCVGILCVSFFPTPWQLCFLKKKFGTFSLRVCVFSLPYRLFQTAFFPPVMFDLLPPIPTQCNPTTFAFWVVLLAFGEERSGWVAYSLLYFFLAHSFSPPSPLYPVCMPGKFWDLVLSIQSARTARREWFEIKIG